MAEVLVCRADELKSGSRIITVDNVEIGVFRYKDGFVAYKNLCPHQGGPACEGMIIPRVVAVLDADQAFKRNDFDENEPHFVCPWHGYEYRLATGECVGDSTIRLKRYDTIERDGCVYVRV
ncbi:Rieske (2Fe-2S) protein [Pseudorhodoplanes sinuspersici]|uniref:Ferredoxin n=1 Tax=Pseudorhodoplanes sinuspersici TaxID=1235591 RepID=A0A1W6ZML8_9HYPH|nr:Rieske 2Fe-2S domain-containing protein [Pseudorhodoplanes sinuspersici]ARP98024.1 ferredoxin [Pseudorhodoplanes sinuspersici]RKE68218.1 nitrite reductase/ring-hydroxylating ferredoxin subunit [Pseudorhodoplanes sinuspersici]